MALPRHPAQCTGRYAMRNKPEYAREYYRKNKDRINAQRRATRKSPRPMHKYRIGSLSEDCTEYKQYRWVLRRLEFFKMYGSVCSCCGESEQAFLALDHIGGQRGRIRERTDTAILNAISTYQPNKYRILCHNCNMATRYDKPCPHQLVYEDYQI